MPAFFPILEIRVFLYRQQLLLRFFFYFLNRSKSLSFHRCFQFWEEENVSGGPSMMNKVVEAWLRFCFWSKSHSHQRCGNWCVILVPKPLLVLPQFCAFLTNYMYTYIQNWPLQPFSQDYDLASYSTPVVCVVPREWWYLQFNVDSQR